MKNTENEKQVVRLIESLYTHVTDLFTEQNVMMQGMKKELRTEMIDMKTELRAEMADMKGELKEAIDANGTAILRLEKEIAKDRETLLRHDLDIQMLKKTFVQTG